VEGEKGMGEGGKGKKRMGEGVEGEEDERERRG
jgi:hypothetical protein